MELVSTFCICRGESVAEILDWVGVIYHIHTASSIIITLHAAGKHP